MGIARLELTYFVSLYMYLLYLLHDLTVINAEA